VAATFAAVVALMDHLVCQGVERLVLESTSDYWRIWYYLADAAGLEVWLVNARDVKHLPGRSKSDRLDCVWLCKLNEWGMLRRSFVPPEPIRDLRALTRLRARLTQDRVRHQNRIEKILEDALLKVSGVISDLMGASGRRFLQALVDGERSPAALAALGDYRLRASKTELQAALTGRFRDIHGFEIGMLLELADDLSAKITLLDERIEAQLLNVPGLGGVCTGCGQLGPAGTCTGCGEQQVLGVIERLDEVTGIGREGAQVVVAELGTDMSQFPTPGHAAAWAKLTPRTIQSGNTLKAGRTGKGDPYLRGTLGAAVMSAGRTDTFLGVSYRRKSRRRGKQKAIVAVSRTITEIAWHIIDDPAFRYIELGPTYHDKLDAGRKTRDKIRQLEQLNPGMTVTLTPCQPAGEEPAA
jgi:transposase